MVTDERTPARLLSVSYADSVACHNILSKVCAILGRLEINAGQRQLPISLIGGHPGAQQQAQGGARASPSGAEGRVVFPAQFNMVLLAIVNELDCTAVYGHAIKYQDTIGLI